MLEGCPVHVNAPRELCGARVLVLASAVKVIDCLKWGAVMLMFQLGSRRAPSSMLATILSSKANAVVCTDEIDPTALALLSKAASDPSH